MCERDESSNAEAEAESHLPASNGCRAGVAAAAGPCATLDREAALAQQEVQETGCADSLPQVRWRRVSVYELP